MPKPRSETESQIAAVAWARAPKTLAELEELDLLHHIPNGEARDRVVAIRLKYMGVLAGIPDLCLPVSRGPAHGLYIEMKEPGRSMSAAQNRVRQRLEAYGYEVQQAEGHENVKRVLRSYLAQPRWQLVAP